MRLLRAGARRFFVRLALFAADNRARASRACFDGLELPAALHIRALSFRLGEDDWAVVLASQPSERAR